MAGNISLLDVVAVTEDMPQHGLVRGQVGTVVEVLADGNYEIEFSGEDGRAYALVPLPSRQLMILRYQPAGAA